MDESEHDDTVTGFFFCVFAAPTAESPPVNAVYLRGAADAHFLEGLFGPLYEREGIGLSCSDDEIIPPKKLSALAAAVRSVVVQVERQPETWPVQLGHRFIPFSKELGKPIYGAASRQRLLEFLHGVLSQIDLAEQHGHSLYWGGGT